MDTLKISNLLDRTSLDCTYTHYHTKAPPHKKNLVALIPIVGNLDLPNSPPLGSTLCRNNKKNREIITTQEIYVETPKQEKNHKTQRRKFTM